MKFQYLIDKINKSTFKSFPFSHITIDNFLSEEHFKEIVESSQIKINQASNTSELINLLIQNGYEVQNFPGCITDIEKYLKSYENKDFDVDPTLLEGFGMVFRIKKFQLTILEELIKFLNGSDFKKCLENKFNITNLCYVESGIQKYLDMYEISPHPDIRKKAATYMLNINPSEKSKDIDIHTYLCSFKPENKWIHEFWNDNINIDRNWVPWDWCTLEKSTYKNNSIVLFRPSNYSLHSVKLSYNHLEFQRTQVYGNLWYQNPPNTKTINYLQLKDYKSY